MTPRPLHLQPCCGRDCQKSLRRRCGFHPSQWGNKGEHGVARHSKITRTFARRHLPERRPRGRPRAAAMRGTLPRQAVRTMATEIAAVPASSAHEGI